MRTPTGQPFQGFFGGREDLDVPQRGPEVFGSFVAEDTHRVRILLLGGADDLLDGVDGTGVDDFHAFVAQEAGQRDGGRIGAGELD